MPRSRAARVAYFGVPMLFCLAVHWLAIKTWFRFDDFAWLGMRFLVHGPHDLLDVLFGPRAQGTIRTLSERVYFLIFPTLFGMNALPLRLWTFLTQFVNLALLGLVTRRVTGSGMAGFLAPVLWSACAVLAIPMNWSSAYNEICCAFFILLAFYLLLRYIETGDVWFWRAQWLAFLLGFGALELNVMYPVLASGYALCCARRYFGRTLYLYIPSVLFTWFHFRFVPQTTDPQYAMHFDPDIVGTFWNHWAFTLGAWRPDRVDWRPLWLGAVLTVIITAGLLWFVGVRIRRNDWRGLFLLAWFFVVILPVLPLTQHASEYYPTIPALGLAMLAAWALSTPRGRRAGPLAAAYLIVSIADIRCADRYFYERARLMKRLVVGLERTSQEHAGKIVLLNGVSNELFSAGFYDDPFRLIGVRAIYLTPGSEKELDPHPELGDISRFVVSTDFAQAALNRRQAVVYGVDPDGIRNITPVYMALLNSQQVARHRERVDVGDVTDAGRLGPGWYPIENGIRWMAKRASVQLSAPEPGQWLYVTGRCPAAAVAQGPVTLALSADGTTLGSATLEKPDQAFALHFSLPGSLVGKYAIEVTAEVNRTFTPKNDPRPLGLVFGTFTIR